MPKSWTRSWRSLRFSSVIRAWDFFLKITSFFFFFLFSLFPRVFGTSCITPLFKGVVFFFFLLCWRLETCFWKSGKHQNHYVSKKILRYNGWWHCSIHREQISCGAFMFPRSLSQFGTSQHYDSQEICDNREQFNHQEQKTRLNFLNLELSK